MATARASNPFAGLVLPPSDATIGNLPRTYRDPSQVALDDGRSMAAILPPAGASRTRGVVIPHATKGGVPRGYDPEDMTDVEVLVDPHLNGDRVRVRVADVTKSAAQAAIALGNQFADANASESMEEIEVTRLAGAASMHVLANIRNNNNPVAETAPRAEGAGYAGAPDVQFESAPPSARRTAPHRLTPQPPTKTASFAPTVGINPQPPTQHAARPASMAARFAPASAATAPAPGTPMQNLYPAAAAPQPKQPPVPVTFEIPGFGRHEAYYHRVIQSGASVILVCDDDSQASRYFPSQIEGDFYAQIDNGSTVYQVQALGSTFSDVETRRTYCMLLIMAENAQEGPHDDANYEE